VFPDSSNKHKFVISIGPEGNVVITRDDYKNTVMIGKMTFDKAKKVLKITKVNVKPITSLSYTKDKFEHMLSFEDSS